MKYSQAELYEFAAEGMDGRSPKEYVTQGVKALGKWIQDDPTGQRWKMFGPYWPGVRELLEEYKSPVAAIAQDWGEVPPYLEHYNYGSDSFNLLAAIAYINRHGDYLNCQDDQPHSIEMPNGANALYLPGSGLVSD